MYIISFSYFIKFYHTIQKIAIGLNQKMCINLYYSHALRGKRKNKVKALLWEEAERERTDLFCKKQRIPLTSKKLCRIL